MYNKYFSFSFQSPLNSTQSVTKIGCLLYCLFDSMINIFVSQYLDTLNEIELALKLLSCKSNYELSLESEVQFQLICVRYVFKLSLQFFGRNNSFQNAYSY